MSTREFRDDDDGYLDWLATHPDSYVINIARNHSHSGARLHLARCMTINGQSPVRGALTGPHMKKVCAEQLAELEQWASDHVDRPIRSCGTCHLGREAVQPTSTKPTHRAHGAAPPEGRYSLAVQAWADDYIRFERSHRPSWQEHLRTELRNCCRQLRPSDGQVLHATFFGDKRPDTDVENLLLYNIGAFKEASRNGIRFEHSLGVPNAPDGVEYPYCYRYAFAPRSSTFDHCQPGRTLAAFGWTNLGAFKSENQAAQVWLAVARGPADHNWPAIAPETPFAVEVEVRPPHSRQPRPDLLVKGILDGVIGAFQAHTDRAVLPVVAARLATVLAADTEEIEELLLDQRRAVLGDVPQLVYPFGKGVKWNPADQLCVAGEVLAAEPVEEQWAIKGKIVELSA